jgi:hypothetical protein
VGVLATGGQSAGGFVSGVKCTLRGGVTAAASAETGGGHVDAVSTLRGWATEDGTGDGDRACGAAAPWSISMRSANEAALLSESGATSELVAGSRSNWAMSLQCTSNWSSGEAAGISFLLGSHVTVSQMRIARVSHAQIL